MFATNTQRLPGLSAGGYFGPAEVCEVSEGRIYLTIPGMTHRVEAAGMLSIPDGSAVTAGTRVLAAAQPWDDVYILGILDSLPKTTAEPSSQPAPSSQDVTLNGQQSLRVFSADHELLFEHDPQQQTTRVHVPSGDLEFVADDGHIHFKSSHGIRLSGQQPVELHSETAVQLQARAPVTQACSSVTIQPHDQLLDTPQLRIRTARLQAEAAHTRFTGQVLRGHLGTIRIVAQTMESVVESLIQRAQTAISAISGLWRVQAGRAHCHSASTLYLKSQNAIVKADEDVKINGDQIHLG